MSRPIRSTSKSIPFPIGGWNARDPEEEMSSLDALRLINIFPETTRGRLRKGFSIHTSTTTGLTGPIEHMHEYNGADGGKKLLVASNNKIWDCSSYGGTPSDLTGALTITNNKWISINFKGTGTAETRAIFVNGSDDPKLFDGTTLTDAAYTGIADQSKISYVISFKQTLYFIENDPSNQRTSLWYADTNAFNGALKEFAVASLFKRGGYLLSLSTFGRDSGSGLEDLFVITSSEGEILVYGGTSPDFSDWNLLGRYDTASPIGKKSLFNLDSDIGIITRSGIVPLSQVIANKEDTQSTQKISDKIQTAFNDAAILYGESFGWEGVIFPDGRFLLVNIPVSDGVVYRQFVMNLYTGAWCEFRGWNGKTFCLFNDNLYMGGLDGKVYRVWHQNSDNGNTIEVDIKLSFNYFDDRESEKLFVQVQPIMTGSPNLNFSLDIDTDFGNKNSTSTVVITGDSTGDYWDEESWDVAEWAGSDLIHYTDWRSIDGYGKCGALKLAGYFKDVEWSVSSFRVMFETGGLM